MRLEDCIDVRDVVRSLNLTNKKFVVVGIKKLYNKC